MGGSAAPAVSARANSRPRQPLLMMVFILDPRPGSAYRHSKQEHKVPKIGLGIKIGLVLG